MTDFRNICKTNVERYAPEERQSYRADFSLNENPLGCSENVLESIKSIDESQINQYQPINQSLIQKIADYEGVESENVIISAGSDKCLQTIALALFKKDQKLAFPTPSFPRYRFYAKLMDSNYKEIEYDLFEGRGKDDILEKASDSDHLIIDNPSNPTGHRFSSEEIKRFSSSYEGNLILDMALEDNSLDIQPIIEDDNFVVKSFSKFMGIAGLRLGYIISSEENIDKLKPIVSPFEVNSVAQIAGEEVLEDIEHLKKSKKYIEEERKFLKDRMDKLDVEYTDSESTNMVLKLEKDKQEELRNRGINFTSGENYRGLPDNVVRMGIRSEDENRVLVEELKDVI